MMGAALAFKPVDLINARPEARQRQLADYSNHYVANVFQGSSASPRQETYDVESAVTSPTRDRKFREQKPIHSIDERGFANVVSLALRNHYGNHKSAIKEIAKASGASCGSAKNWLAGLTTPHALYLERLKDEVPGLEAEMRRLRAMQAEIDPNFQRAFTRFMQRMGQF